MYQENFYEDMVKFGEALRILRKRKNLTQNDMARIAGIDRKHLSDVELGKHKAGLELALILCVALGVNRFELFALAWEEDYKIYRQKVLQEEAEKQCSSDLQPPVLCLGRTGLCIFNDRHHPALLLLRSDGGKM